MTPDQIATKPRMPRFRSAKGMTSTINDKETTTPPYIAFLYVDEQGRRCTQILCECNSDEHARDLAGRLNAAIEREMADALRAALDSVTITRTSGWQGIAFAPKDGTRLILALADDRVCVGAWESNSFWSDFADSGGFRLERATHWQAVPPAPAQEP